MSSFVLQPSILSSELGGRSARLSTQARPLKLLLFQVKSHFALPSHKGLTAFLCTNQTVKYFNSDKRRGYYLIHLNHLYLMLSVCWPSSFRGSDISTTPSGAIAGHILVCIIALDKFNSVHFLPGRHCRSGGGGRY